MEGKVLVLDVWEVSISFTASHVGRFLSDEELQELRLIEQSVRLSDVLKMRCSEGFSQLSRKVGIRAAVITVLIPVGLLEEDD